MEKFCRLKSQISQQIHFCMHIRLYKFHTKLYFSFLNIFPCFQKLLVKEFNSPITQRHTKKHKHIKLQSVTESWEGTERKFLSYPGLPGISEKTKFNIFKKINGKTEDRLWVLAHFQLLSFGIPKVLDTSIHSFNSAWFKTDHNWVTTNAIYAFKYFSFHFLKANLGRKTKRKEEKARPLKVHFTKSYEHYITRIKIIFNLKQNSVFN